MFGLTQRAASMYSLPCCKKFRRRRVHGVANLARVVSKTLPAGFEEIMLQIAAPRCAALLPSLQCNSRKLF